MNRINHNVDDEINKRFISKLDLITNAMNKLACLVEERFDTLNKRITKVETQNDTIIGMVSNMEKKGMNFGSSGDGGEGNLHCFSKIENKEEYLNTNITNVIDRDVITYLKEQSSKFINHQHVYDIMHQTYDLYEFVSMIIHCIISDCEDKKFLYCFPFQKTVIYYWNMQKGSWEKMNTVLLKKVFNTIQYELVVCYNSLIKQLQDENTFHFKSQDFMENGNLIFCDDFDKKYKVFKKLLFEKICS